MAPLRLHRFARALPTGFIGFAVLACVPNPEPASSTTKTEPAASTTDAPAPAEPEPAPVPVSESEPDLSEWGMPAPGTWAITDYVAASKAIHLVAKQRPELLPRAGSPIFTQLTDVERLRELASAHVAERLLGLSLAVGSVREVYAERRVEAPEFDREWLIATAAVLAPAARLPTMNFADAAAIEPLRANESQLQGALRYRHGIHAMVASMYEWTPSPDSKLSYAFACEQLARIAPDVAPLLLSEEREAARARLPACTSAGTKPELVEQIATAFAEDAPTTILVEALVPEHRAFAAAEQD